MPARAVTPESPAPGQPADAAGGNADPLRRAIDGMREAHDRIARQELGEPTLDVQRQVVRDLEKLIELAKRPPSQSGSSSTQDGNRQEQQPAGDEPSSGERQQAGDQQPGQVQPSDEPGEAANAAGKGNDKEDASIQFRRQLVNEIWGHLPPAIRERVRTDYSVRPLPEYEEQIRRYFRALAEQQRFRSQPPVRRRD